MNLIHSDIIGDALKRKKLIIKFSWIAAEIILLNTIIYLLQEYSISSQICVIGILAFICKTKESRKLVDIGKSVIEQYGQFDVIKERMVDAKFRASLVVTWINLFIKIMLDLRKHAPGLFCIVACGFFGVLGYIGSISTVVNSLYLATFCVDLIRERTENFRRTTQTLAEAADVSLLRFEAQMKRESEDMYDDIVLPDEFHDIEPLDNEPVSTPTKIRKYNAENKFPLEDARNSPILQLSDQKATNVLLIKDENTVEKTPLIEFGEEALPKEMTLAASAIDVTKSGRKKKLFSFGSQHEEFSPVDMKMEPGSPRSSVKKQISTSKSMLSFLSRHK